MNLLLLKLIYEIIFYSWIELGVYTYKRLLIDVLLRKYAHCLEFFYNYIIVNI